MSPEQQHDFLKLLLRGLSPQLICEQLGIDVFAYFETARTVPLFAQRLAEVRALKSQNIEASLYKEAFGSSAAAKAQYLKLAPPPEWRLPPAGESNFSPQAVLLENLCRADAHCGGSAWRDVSPGPGVDGEGKLNSEESDGRTPTEQTPDDLTGTSRGTPSSDQS